VFAGLRDDPFFNNLEGFGAALGSVAGAVAGGVPLDGAGCPQLDPQTSATALEAWHHTADGGPAANYLAGWTTSALVVSIDLDLVNTGGDMLAVWAAIYTP
jgi:hypothetical protein